MRILRNPTLKSGKRLLEDSLREEKPTIIVGSCVVNYRGRAGSVLPEGERIVVIKPDGTLLVHQKEKREPVNWNPPGCTAQVNLGKRGLKLISRRSRPKETLLVLFKELKIVASFELVDEEELQLIGTEEDLVDSVLQNPSIIEEGFQPKEREKPTRSGVVDLYGEDSESRGVAIEFKRGKATLSAVGQLSRYIKELEQKLDEDVRGIIAAPEITSGARRLLNKEKLEYVKIEKTPTHSFEDVIYDKSQKQIKEFTQENKDED